MTPHRQWAARLALVATMVAVSVVGSVAGAWAQASTVDIGPASGVITLGSPVRSVPVTISRTSATPLMAFSVVFSVSSPLDLSGGTGGIHEGAYLSAANPVTSFNVIDRGVDGFGNHLYQADGTTLGAPCGSSAASGTLFSLDLASSATGGLGSVTISSLKLRDCGNADLPSVIGAPSTIQVDRSAPGVAVTSPNTGVTWYVGSSEIIEWSGSDTEGVASYALEYSTDGGATYPFAIATVPGTESSYPWTIPAAAGTQVRVRVTATDVNGNAATDDSDVDFTIAYYTLTYAAGADGTISGTTVQAVAHGGSGTPVTAVPNTGYHFVSWSDGVLTAARTDLNVTANLSVTAAFAINEYTLTYTAGPNGTILGTTPQTVAHGSDGTTVTAEPNTGYHFVSWSDGVLTAARTDLGVTTSLSVTASFAIDVFTITATAGPNGAIAPPGVTNVDYGGSQGYTITPDPGYHVLDVLVDGATAGAVTSYTFSSVSANHTIAASFQVNPVVPALTNLAATQRRTSNPVGATTGVTLSWDPTPNNVEVWRAGYGHYPEYDGAGGTEPAVPGTHPPGGDWVLTAVVAPGDVDLATTRDFYYYAAYQQDSYGTWSAATMTGGTLNYHLGDVSDGATLGAGNNSVFTEDLSALGGHYGLSGPALAPFAYLDVGPTTTRYIDGRPAPDNAVGFEDLVMFAINFGAVSAPSLKATPVAGAAATAGNEVALDAPGRVEAGATVTTRVKLRTSGGLVAISTTLGWDPAVVEPIGHAAGDWLMAADGVAFSATPGTVDAAVTRPQGMSGEGVLATITFRAISAGDPKFRIAATDGRDARNQRVVMTRSLAAQGPAVTQLAPSRPNPFRQATSISFSLARGGPVEMHLYSVDGRRVRTLVDGVREPGEYTVAWDGRSDDGGPVPAGVYFLRMTTPQGRFTKTVTYLR
ncbi:MAG TPA: FlgD immunoglobulin-like domain containing protein [Vicinamibacterales bacterium]